jgi:hypothetical protein
MACTPSICHSVCLADEGTCCLKGGVIFRPPGDALEPSNGDDLSIFGWETVSNESFDELRLLLGDIDFVEGTAVVEVILRPTIKGIDSEAKQDVYPCDSETLRLFDGELLGNVLGDLLKECYDLWIFSDTLLKCCIVHGPFLLTFAQYRESTLRMA